MSHPEKLLPRHKVPTQLQALSDQLTVTANWWAVYFEPMAGSGERLTAFVVAADAHGKSLVSRTLGDGVLRALYGGKALGVMAMLELVEDSIKAHAKDHHGALSWEPPMSGFHLGPLRKLRSSSLQAALKSAVQFCASLGTVAMLDQSTLDAEMAANVWRDQVRERVLSQNILVRGRFDHKVELVNNHAVRIGFVADNYAAQFGVLRSSATRISNDILRLKGRLVDLAQLRGDLFRAISERELLIGHPNLQQLGFGTKLQLRVSQKVSLITQEADAFDIRVRATDNAEEAAAWITQKAA